MRRKLGQHFLTDQGIIARILQTADIQAHDWVVEIGPGKGALTFTLARHVQHLFALEYDSELAERLHQRCAEFSNIHIIQADARHVNYEEIGASYNRRDVKLKLIANLPYYAAIPIMRSIFQYAAVFCDCTLMFQKEVAERLTASPGSKAYGFITLLTQYYSTARYCFTVPSRAFSPRPKVESAVVKLEFLESPPAYIRDREYFFHLITCAFLSRRKTLKNALVAHGSRQFSVKLLHLAFQHLQFPENIRGEELSFADFARLSNELLHLHDSLTRKRDAITTTKADAMPFQTGEE